MSKELVKDDMILGRGIEIPHDAINIDLKQFPIDSLDELI